MLYISILFNDAFIVFSLIGTKKEEEKVAVRLCIQNKDKLSVVNFLPINYSSHVAAVNIPGFLVKKFPGRLLVCVS